MGNLLTPHCKINKPNSNFFTFVKIKEVSFFLGQHNFSCVPWITHSIPLFCQNPVYIPYHFSSLLYYCITTQTWSRISSCEISLLWIFCLSGNYFVFLLPFISKLVQWMSGSICTSSLPFTPVHSRLESVNMVVQKLFLSRPPLNSFLIILNLLDTFTLATVVIIVVFFFSLFFF